MIRILVLAIVLCAAAIRPLAAQDTNFVPMPAADSQAPPGWSFVPTIAVGTSYDDNVLIRGQGDQTPGDMLSTINPRGALDYNGGRGQLSASYDGSLLLYRQLDQLNSLDQHASFYGHRLLTKHVAVFVRESLADVPTTELQQLVAIPFVRTGSVVNDLHSGVEAGLTKRTSMTVSYDFQFVNFDQGNPPSTSLIGGHSNGASAVLKHVLNARLTLTANYDIQHAILDDQQTALGVFSQTFDVQNARAGAEYRLSEGTHVFGDAGISRLDVSQFNVSRTGPAWRMGLVHKMRQVGVDILYARSFVPSYGFGGTMQNEELTGRVQLPISRRMYTSSAVSWRRDDPIIETALFGNLPLRSVWLEGTFGYAMSPQIRLEVFYAGTHQTIDRPGGVLDRNRVGVQIVAAKPMRIR
ncbi:MAG TPA: hypothetical protein VGG73_15410 [Vicinamibacterales bacterium]|jgi:hypothetical protein